MSIYFVPDQSSDEEYEDNVVQSKTEISDHDEESDDLGDDNDEVLKSNMSWKENLAQKAREAFLDRHSNTDNLMKLVYGVFSIVSHFINCEIVLN